jgi:hypothetical protein
MLVPITARSVHRPAGSRLSWSATNCTTETGEPCGDGQEIRATIEVFYKKATT